MSRPEVRVKIYGARGSYACTNLTTSSVGVNTTCVRIDIGKHILIFDAGSGIINLGQDLITEMHQKRSAAPKWKFHLFFTHFHLDHLAGFPFFAMLYMPKSEIHFFGPKILNYSLEDTLRTFMHPPFFPVGMHELPFEGHFYQISEKNVVYFYEGDFLLQTALGTPDEGWLAKMSCMRNYMHPKGGSFFYKLENTAGRVMVFASDTEGLIGGDQRLIKFAKGVDLLFHDAQYTPAEYLSSQGFGHSTYEMACEVAQKAGVKKLVLFHHDPKYNDETLKEIESSARKLFPETFSAAESMEFVL